MCHRLNEYEQKRTLLLLARVEELSPADEELLFDWRFKDPTRYEKYFMIKAVVVTDS